MLKAYILVVLWLIVACNCRSLETRARISTNNEDEHVHIKVMLPKVLRKHKLPRHTTRPHYAKHLPTHYEAISRPTSPQQQAATTHTIFSQHHNDFEIPAPMPMLTTEHEILAHIAAAAPLADNDISLSQSIRTQRKKQQQKRTPTMMPPSPVPLSSPMMAQQLYGGTTSTLFDGNVLTADDFLREVQQLYAQKYEASVTPTLMMEPQMQALTKTTTSTPTTTMTTMKKQKKRKHSNSFHLSKPTNSQQYYAKEQQQQQQQEPNLQQGFKPYSSKQAYSNYYYYNDYNNKNFFDSEKTKFNIIEHTPMGANELSTDNTTNDIDANSSSTEDYTADSVSDTVMAFSAPIHPEEPSSFLSSSSPYSITNNMQTKTHNYYNTNVDDGYDDNYDDGSDGGFNPISYQDLYATYTATPAAHHLSTMPARLKFKRQQHTIQQPLREPLREQFVQLSSIAPAVSSGINTLRSTQRAPPTTTTSIVEDMGSIYGAAQQPLELYRKQKNRIKVKRNRLMVQ